MKGFFSLTLILLILGAAHATTELGPDDVDVDGCRLQCQEHFREFLSTPWNMLAPEWRGEDGEIFPGHRVVSLEAVYTFGALFALSLLANLVFLLCVIPACCFLCGRKPKRVIRYRRARDWKPNILEEEESSGVCDHA